jgi:hypothetical protein
VVVGAVGAVLVGGALGLAPSALAVNPHVHFVDGGTGVPAATIGGYTMTPFAADTRATEDTAIGTTVTAPNGTLTFSHSMNHWLGSELNGEWGNGFSGDVYEPDDRATGTITMTLPANTKAFEFYGLSNDPGTYTITAQTDDGTSSGGILVTTDTAGSNAAHGFAFYTDDGSAIASVTATLQSTSTHGIFLGEFSLADLNATKTTLTADTTTPAVGQTDTFTANVTRTSASGTPSGSVAFYLDGSTTASDTETLASGQASFTTTFTTAGPHTVTATYAGNSIDATSTDTLAVNVPQATALSHLTGSVFGGPFSATLTSDGVPLPGQTVTFTTGTGSAKLTICSAITNSHGVATCTFAYSTTAGKKILSALLTNGSFTATFGGSDDYTASSTTSTGPIHLV